MKLFVEHLLNIFFPKSEDERLLSSCSDADYIKKYFPNTYKGILSLSPFKDPYIKASIHLNKFHYHKRAAHVLSLILLKGIASLPNNTYILIPIPLSTKRQRSRGYNQVTEVIKDALSHMPTCTLHEHILIKKSDTPPQTTLTKEERLSNLTNAFSVNPNQSHILTNQHILLIDDVTTTGATLLEAQKVLYSCKPASVTCIALAH